MRRRTPENPWGQSASRYKYVPYLTVHCERTERVEDTATAVVTITLSLTISHPFCTYLSGLSGGPALHYWYHMNEQFSSNGWQERNSGSGPDVSATMINAWNAHGLSASVSSIVSNVCDGGWGVRYLGQHLGVATGVAFRAPIAISAGSSAFTAGGWYNLQDNVGSILFQSNMGGTSGNQRGVYMFVSGLGAVEVWYGDNAGSSQDTNARRYRTANGVFGFNVTHFVALYCRPTSDVNNVLHKLYVDGTEASLSYYSGSAAAIAWPVDANVGVGWPGTSDIRSNDPQGIYDEVFLHFNEITPAQIAEIWARGTA